MRPAYTGSQVRAAEAPLLEEGQGPALMARAARGLELAVARDLKSTRGRVHGTHVAAVVGKGNNGGDALFALAGLARRGVRATAVLAHGAAHPAALEAFGRAGGRLAEPGDSLDHADAVIDAVLGTGFSGVFRAPHPRPDARVIACDVPSGLNADTGAAGPEVWRADVTVTFGALKSGLVVGRGRELAGEVEVVDIGLGPHLPDPDVRSLEPDDAARLLPAPRPDWHKYSRGVLGVVAGSREYPGAAVLTVAGALAAGVGMVRVLAPERVRDLVLAAHPEAVGGAGRVQAWAVGPGIADDADQHRALQSSLASGLPVVVDASGLGGWAADLEASGAGPDERMVLTPHAGELAALLGSLAGGGVAPEREDIEAEPLRWARGAARRCGTTVLLKGAATVCAAPDGTVFVQSQGHPYLATAGSGDTLTGILGALLATASGARPVELAALAAFVHGSAGRIAAEGGPYGAGQLAGAVREAVARLQRG
ncbi:NAD(P)H-hydrate dehydratase [Sinomonas halotolerans]|uniref:ADP-dependent (S)-NAD(P)H-hydrate dehydratase n=1 Tax=Sinomonas halotolerans TaxID=1644133 RepID=A0ABU9X2C7_9MICC